MRGAGATTLSVRVVASNDTSHPSSSTGYGRATSADTAPTTARCRARAATLTSCELTSTRTCDALETVGRDISHATRTGQGSRRRDESSSESALAESSASECGCFPTSENRGFAIGADGGVSESSDPPSEPSSASLLATDAGASAVDGSLLPGLLVARLRPGEDPFAAFPAFPAAIFPRRSSSRRARILAVLALSASLSASARFRSASVLVGNPARTR